jgi:hypothetical protein
MIKGCFFAMLDLILTIALVVAVFKGLVNVAFSLAALGIALFAVKMIVNGRSKVKSPVESPPEDE